MAHRHAHRRRRGRVAGIFLDVQAARWLSRRLWRPALAEARTRLRTHR